MHSISENRYRFIQKPFTLLEIVVVIAIMLLFAAIIVANISIPVFVTLDKTTKSVRKIFSDAQRQTAFQGKEALVTYDPERKEFKLIGPSNGEGSGSDLIPMGPDVDSKTLNSQFSLIIPDKVEVEFPEYEGETIEYRFFPDGSASGPEMNLTLKGRKMVIGVSRLTGIAYSREEEE